MSNLDDQTLEILASLNAAQPSTQQVDYSQFMNDFQPVQNYPNYFVPQQGLLQNTPVLDTLSDLDVMQQRPQVVTNMLDQYPTLESDFQRSFAVSPDTFNMNVYQPLPYDPNYWQSFVNQGGGIGGDSGIDLGTAAGLVAGATSLLGGGDDDDDNGDDNGDDGGNESGGSDGAGTATTIISSGTDNGTSVDNTDLDIKDGTTVDGGNNTGNTTLLGGSNDDDIDGSTNDNTIIKDGTLVGGNNSNVNGIDSNTIINTVNSSSSSDSADGNTTLDTKDSGFSYITKNDANDIIQSLIDSNDISLVEASSLIDTINNTNAAFGPALLSGLNQIKNTKVPIQIGFNRRFDSSHAKAQQARVKKEIGELEMIVITSRDPEPPGIDYLKAAGGFFRDTTIHDFDLARFILGNDPVVQISAFGEALFDKNSKKQKDHDTAMFILKSKKGVLIHINNSRRAVYGYDQRVEVFGSKGMIISNNQTTTSVERYTSKSTSVKDPVHFFFIERYEQAYKDQFNEFVKCVTKKTKPKVTFEDGKNALIIANAAYEAYKKGKVVNIKF